VPTDEELEQIFEDALRNGDGASPEESPFTDAGYLAALEADPEAHRRSGDALALLSAQNLPGEFWEARVALGSIRDAAWARFRSPDAVLAGALARVASLTPPTLRLPAIVGDLASLDLLTALVGPSGTGKSAATTISAALIRHRRDDVIEVAIGSGEGLIDAYLGAPQDARHNGAPVKVRPQINTAVLAVVDEGQVIAELAERKGSTLLPTLRSATFGAALGQANADPSRRRRLEALHYRFAGIIALQPEHAVALLDDAAGGTPQRIIWLSATDPSIPDEPPSWPGALGWVPPPTITNGSELNVAAEVVREIRSRALARARGARVVEPLDAHGDLLRLKVSGLLAVLDGRADQVTAEDWRLAGMVMTASRSVRRCLVETRRLLDRQRLDASIARVVERETAVAESAERRALDGAARAVARRAHRDGPDSRLTRGDLNRAIAGQHRLHVNLDEVLEEAIARGWLRQDGEHFQPGESRPA
jgi:hypothetical protein